LRAQVWRARAEEHRGEHDIGQERHEQQQRDGEDGKVVRRPARAARRAPGVRRLGCARAWVRARASGQAANAAGTDQHCMPPHRPSRASAVLEGVQASGASRLPTSGTGSAVSAAAVSMRSAVACHETRAGRRYTAAPKRPSSAVVSATVPTHSVSVGTHESCWLPSIHGTSATARRGGRGAPTSAWRRNEAGCAPGAGARWGRRHET